MPRSPAPGRRVFACRPTAPLGRGRPRWRPARPGTAPRRRGACAASRLTFCWASRPNATFSHTVRLSKRAPAWNSMPIWRLIGFALAAAHLQHVAAIDLDRTRIGLDQAEDGFQQHRLAGARPADHHHGCAGHDVEVDPIQAPACRRSACAARGCEFWEPDQWAKNNSVRTRSRWPGSGWRRRPRPTWWPNPRPLRRRGCCSRGSSPSARSGSRTPRPWRGR